MNILTGRIIFPAVKQIRGQTQFMYVKQILLDLFHRLFWYVCEFGFGSDIVFLREDISQGIGNAKAYTFDLAQGVFEFGLARKVLIHETINASLGLSLFGRLLFGCFFLHEMMFGNFHLKVMLAAAAGHAQNFLGRSRQQRGDIFNLNPMFNHNVQQLAIQRSGQYVIVPHINPDPDALAAAFVLARLLMKQVGAAVFAREGDQHYFKSKAIATVSDIPAGAKEIWVDFNCACRHPLQPPNPAGDNH